MAQYDSISKGYRAYTSIHPWCAKIFLPSVRRLVGDVKDFRVLDLACGDGAQTLRLKKWGASKVVGVDISQGSA
jgi:toxoflavin synthase